MSDIIEFIVHYTPMEREKIAFAWNGKHAAEFIDANQSFRWTVVKECIDNSERVPLSLLEDLFLADAHWAVQAWGTPEHFAQLGCALLVRGGSDALESFAKGFNASFDTFGACHDIQLPVDLLPQLMTSVREMHACVTDERQKVELESTLQLFQKLEGPTATDGWVKIAPKTEVSKIRVVWPRWHHKAWAWFFR
ncbi:hypothetical protein [Massilia sp. CF038]|uniref:hypothetical protein n=1 Tax=Massilia sp. CF038 TaxID=1881045 RepID=UPI00093409A4|nr:hypothetical protein [Massilia sp. CF038]